MRVKEGALLEIIERQSGKVYEAVVQDASKDFKVKIIREKAENFPQSKISFLLFALCKGDTNDWVLEKACELAVTNVILWQGDHSVVKLKSEDDIKKKLVRWQKICDSGSKQSGNPRTTMVHFAEDLKKALEICKGNLSDKIFYGAISNEAKNLKEIASTFTSAAVIIGPEGDFSKNELDLLKTQEALGINLGPYILRAETAAISAVSSFNALFGYN